MDFNELQQLVIDFCQGNVNVFEMPDDKLKELAGGLSSMYQARVFNCVDGTGKSDKEWLGLSDLLKRLAM